ncbi:MAG: type I glyceraldehyde-3-phosphate dehydrogenase [Candidatus Omnitrophota bacterium]
MAVRVGINGFGRIGRLALKAALKSKNLEFVAVNDLTDTKTLAHLFKYDSTFGTFDGEVGSTEDSILINGKKIKVFNQKDPALIPWKDLGIEIVLESTGKFTEADKAKTHMASGGVKKVLISAPAKGEDATFCMGVNEEKYDSKKHNIISNASCTTNCLAPVSKVLLDNFGIKRGYMTTIHSYTNDQVTLDFPHKDLRRARTAAQNIIITKTGAAAAIGSVIPELKGKMDGAAIRVPTPNVSLVVLNAELEKKTTAEEINAFFKKAAASDKMKKYFAVTDEPLVSRDFNGCDKSATVDAQSTKVIDGDFATVFAWYDNEWGYSCRLIDLTEYIAGKGI